MSIALTPTRIAIRMPVKISMRGLTRVISDRLHQSNLQLQELQRQQDSNREQSTS